MNIAIILRSLDNGGIASVSINLGKEFIAQGYTVHFVVLSDKIIRDIPDGINLHVISNFLKSPLNLISRALNKFIHFLPSYIAVQHNSKKFDLYIKELERKYSDFDAVLLQGYGVYSCVYKSKHPHLFFCSHNTKSLMILNRTYGSLVNFTYGYFRYIFKNRNVIAVSKGIKNDLLKVIKIKPSDIAAIYNPIDFNHIMNASHVAVPANYKYILHVARFVKEKRHDLILDAMQKINDKAIKLVLLGKGPERDNIINMIDKLELTDRVVMIDYDDNPYRWMKNALILILCSDYEGLPTVLIESLICGTVVVSSDCPSGPAEILTGEFSQYLCPMNDSTELANRINSVLNAGIKTLNCDKILKKFSPDDIINQYTEFFKKHK